MLYLLQKRKKKLKLPANEIDETGTRTYIGFK